MRQDAKLGWLSDHKGSHWELPSRARDVRNSLLTSRPEARACGTEPRSPRLGDRDSLPLPSLLKSLGSILGYSSFLPSLTRLAGAPIMCKRIVGGQYCYQSTRVKALLKVSEQCHVHHHTKLEVPGCETRQGQHTIAILILFWDHANWIHGYSTAHAHARTQTRRHI